MRGEGDIVLDIELENAIKEIRELAKWDAEQERKRILKEESQIRELELDKYYTVDSPHNIYRIVNKINEIINYLNEKNKEIL